MGEANIKGMIEVIVVGGGFAGLAAGALLADAGAHVTVLERRPVLGGRALVVSGRTSFEIVQKAWMAGVPIAHISRASMCLKNPLTKASTLAGSPHGITATARVFRSGDTGSSSSETPYLQIRPSG